MVKFKGLLLTGEIKLLFEPFGRILSLGSGDLIFLREIYPAYYNVVVNLVK